MNRSVIVIKPKQSFLDWLHTADPTSRSLTVRELVQEPTVYLSRECDTKDDVRQARRELGGEIFLEQLSGWFRDTTTWPRNRLDIIGH